MRSPEPCLCGDPYCKLCFPGSHESFEDEDEAYEIMRQREIDEARLEDKHDGLREERKLGHDV